MHGVKRVIVFCILTVIIPTSLIIIPLYLRNSVFADVVYPVAESDIIEIRDGISSVFCQRHSLRMNSHFNAFQLRTKPEISTNRKHIRLKKSMTLPDDTLEYWGFYLLKGAKVHLKFCSRYDRSRILVVKGQRELKTCGLLDHNKNKVGASFAQGHDRVSVFFEEITEFTDPVLGNIQITNNNSEYLPREKKEDIDDELENHAGEDLNDYADLLSDTIVASRGLSNLNNTNITINVFDKSKYEKSENKSKNKTEKNTLNKDSIRAQKLRTELIDNYHNSSLYRHRRHHATTKNHHEKIPAKETKNDNNNILRVHRRRNAEKKKRVYDLLYGTSNTQRYKRDHVYDRKYIHGGNAVNFTDDESNSISSFENGLFECYNGNILLAEGFPPSSDCLSAHFLENGSHHMMSKHEITQDGYYYYIFYSDNDLVRNDIHAIFDIYKPTFQYSNLSDSQGCVNSTNCTFSIGFLSDEIVVVEVPTRDGIEHEEDDISYLISTCHPRMHIYAIFPITVLILILSCSFL